MSTPTTDAPTTSAPANGTTRSDYHHVVSDDRRRAVLAVLAERDAPIDLDDVAAAVADRTGDADATDVAVSLHHVHLPVIDDADLADYDPDERVVADYSPGIEMLVEDEL